MSGTYRCRTDMCDTSCPSTCYATKLIPVAPYFFECGSIVVSFRFYSRNLPLDVFEANHTVIACYGSFRHFYFGRFAQDNPLRVKVEFCRRHSPKNMYVLSCFIISIVIMRIHANFTTSWGRVQYWQEMFWGLSIWGYTRALPYSILACFISMFIFNFMGFWDPKIQSARQKENDHVNKKHENVLHSNPYSKSQKDKVAVYIYIITAFCFAACLLSRLYLYMPMDKAYQRYTEQEKMNEIYLEESDLDFDGGQNNWDYYSLSLRAEYIENKIITGQGVFVYIYYVLYTQAASTLASWLPASWSILPILFFTISGYVVSILLRLNYFISDPCHCMLLHTALVCVALDLFSQRRKTEASLRKTHYLVSTQIFGQLFFILGLILNDFTAMTTIFTFILVEYVFAAITISWVNRRATNGKLSKRNASFCLYGYSLIWFFISRMMGVLPIHLLVKDGELSIPQSLNNWSDIFAIFSKESALSAMFQSSSMFIYGVLSSWDPY